MFANAEAPQPPAPASLIEDCIDIWFAPSSVFARRQGGAWGPFLVTSVLLCVLFFAAMGQMQGLFDAQLATALADVRADSPNVTEEQLAQIQGAMEASIRYGGLVAMPAVVFGLGVVVWLLAKLLGGTLSFGGGVMIASFAYMPKALDLLAFIAQSFVLDGGATAQFQYSVGVGRFLDPAMNKGLYLFLGRADLFTIWVTVLLTLGLIHTAKVERTKAIAAGAALWVLGGLPALLQALAGR